MPNLVMEYTHSVDERINVQSLLEDLHTVLIKSEYFALTSIKSRAIRLHHWLVGDLADSVDFIHLTLEPLAGLSDEQKSILSAALMAVLNQQALHVQSLTINIRDMDPLCFAKETHFS
jgi:5-carboxymethyl-2-hydroxymuconate isomerase